MKTSARFAHAHQKADDEKCYPEKNLAETKIQFQFERQQFEQQTEFKNLFCISRKQIAAFDIVNVRTPHTRTEAAAAALRCLCALF